MKPLPMVLLVTLLSSPLGRGDEFNSAITDAEVQALVDASGNRMATVDILVQKQVNSGELPSIDSASIPSAISEHAITWIERVLKPDWYDAGLRNTLRGIKDVQPTRPSSYGVRGPYEGPIDYVMAQYSIRGHAITIMDSGVSLSVTIRLPGGSSDEDIRPQQVEGLARRFLLLSDDQWSQIGLRTSVGKNGGLHGIFRLPPGKVSKPVRLPEGKWMRHTEWWHHMTVSIVGPVVHIWVGEVIAGEYDPSPIPGFPDRF